MIQIAEIRNLFVIFSVEKIKEVVRSEDWRRAVVTVLSDGESYSIDHLNKIFYN